MTSFFLVMIGGALGMAASYALASVLGSVLLLFIGLWLGRATA